MPIDPLNNPNSPELGANAGLGDQDAEVTKKSAAVIAMSAHIFTHSQNKEKTAAEMALAAKIHANNQGGGGDNGGNDIPGGGTSGATPIDQLNTMDLEAVMMCVMSQRASVLDGQVRDYADEVSTDNTMLANDNAAMEEANSCANGATCTGNFTYTDPTTGATSTMSVDAYCNKQGISTGGSGTSGWNTTYSNIKTSSDSLTSSSQLATTELQQSMQSYNEAFTQLSDFVSNIGTTNSSLISNTRG